MAMFSIGIASEMFAVSADHFYLWLYRPLFYYFCVGALFYFFCVGHFPFLSIYNSMWWALNVHRPGELYRLI